MTLGELQIEIERATEVLIEALHEIVDKDDSCGCTQHYSNDCCIQADAFCPHCIAEHALNNYHLAIAKITEALTNPDG